MAGFTIKSAQQLLEERKLEASGRAQKFLDTQVVAVTEPYVPMDKGVLKKALGTQYGSGDITYGVPYARRQWVHGRSPGTSIHGPLRGRKFWERMKADKKGELRKMLADFVGGKVTGG